MNEIRGELQTPKGDYKECQLKREKGCFVLQLEKTLDKTKPWNNQKKKSCWKAF